MFDQDGNGLVDFREFCLALAKACLGPGYGRLRFLFSLFDVHAAGVLSRQVCASYGVRRWRWLAGWAGGAAPSRHSRLACLLGHLQEFRPLVEYCWRQAVAHSHTGGAGDTGVTSDAVAGPNPWVEEQLTLIADPATPEEFVKWAAKLDVAQLLAPFEVVPTPERERLVVQSLMQNSRVREGDTRWIVSAKWWRSWKAYVEFAEPDAVLEDARASPSAGVEAWTSPTSPDVRRSWVCMVGTRHRVQCLACHARPAWRTVVAMPLPPPTAR